VARRTLSAAQLYAILDREFKHVRPPECGKCRIPLPYFREPADAVSSNWYLGTAPECPHRCHTIIAELMTKLWSKYDIEQELPH